MRAFVTGGQGFVGTWLQDHLRESGDDVDIADAGLDIGDADGLRRAVVDAAPDAVYHLAAFTHVGQSWDEPEEVFRVNAVGTLNLLEAARRCPSPPRVLLTSSAEVYGAVKPEHLPLTERSPLLPVSPYAASKVAAEFLGVQAHLGHGLPVIRARAFNHVGPGQAPSFAVSALAKRIVEAERAGGKELRVGNLRPRRDFTDVRDVVRAYRLLILRGEAGGVYNVCSGTDVAIEDIAHRLLTIAGSQFELVSDPGLERPADVPVLRGDSTLLRSATGWRPTLALDVTLRAVLDHWRAARD
ncbi:MAG: NAD-dependent epimerase/dehydratase family protein [Actinobacteria bacterium]|nr:MAG: NAD-dependent epimerase/dehydratase family protein [Actinomycetota bacterium]